MVVWGVVSSEIEQVIEFFRTRREAERMLAEVVRDEPTGRSFSTSSASSSAGNRRTSERVRHSEHREHGAQLVDEVVQYKDAYRLCYVQGPEGILVGLAQQIG
jgi:hypothetical protein